MEVIKILIPLFFNNVDKYNLFISGLLLLYSQYFYAI
jgi:hypothetical protein